MRRTVGLNTARPVSETVDLARRFRRAEQLLTAWLHVPLKERLDHKLRPGGRAARRGAVEPAGATEVGQAPEA